MHEVMDAQTCGSAENRPCKLTDGVVKARHEQYATEQSVA